MNFIRCSKQKSIAQMTMASTIEATITRMAELWRLFHEGHVTFCVSSIQDSLR